MAPDLIKLIDEYYEARKPYSELLQEAHTTPSSQNSTSEPDISTTEPSEMAPSEQQEPQFSLSPTLPKEELSDVLKKLEAAKIEYAQQGEKFTGKASSSSSSSSAGKKGKAPAGKE